MWDFQAVTFLFPIVGGHQQPLKGSRFHHPKKVTRKFFFFLMEFATKGWCSFSHGVFVSVGKPISRSTPFLAPTNKLMAGGEGWMWVKSEKFRYIASNSKLKCLILVWIFKGPRWITLRHTETRGWHYHEPLVQRRISFAKKTIAVQHDIRFIWFPSKQVKLIS